MSFCYMQMGNRFICRTYMTYYNWNEIQITICLSVVIIHWISCSWTISSTIGFHFVFCFFFCFFFLFNICCGLSQLQFKTGRKKMKYRNTKTSGESFDFLENEKENPLSLNDNWEISLSSFFFCNAVDIEKKNWIFHQMTFVFFRSLHQNISRFGTRRIEMMYGSPMQKRLKK